MIESVKAASAAVYSGGASVPAETSADKQVSESSYEVSLSSGLKFSASEIPSIRQQAESANDTLRALVAKLLLKQGGAYSEALSGQDSMTPKQAQDAISEDGDWGVKAVSDRIVSFAISMSGGDTSKLEELKAAINKGFEKAGAAFGGSLPGICGETYNAVMEKLDNWAQKGGVDTEV